MITMPNADSHQDRVLQEDNTELAYECSLRRLEPHAAPRQPRLTVCSLYHWQSRASSPGTPPRVRAALKPHATHRTRSTHTPTLPRGRPRHQGHPRGAPSRARPRRPRPALLTRRSLARRWPPAASALLPPVCLCPVQTTTGSQTYFCVLRLAQTTRSCPRCVTLCLTQTYPLHLRLSHTHPSPLPFARADFGERREAPVRASARILTLIVSRAHRASPPAHCPPRVCAGWARSQCACHPTIVPVLKTWSKPCLRIRHRITDVTNILVGGLGLCMLQCKPLRISPQRHSLCKRKLCNSRLALVLSLDPGRHYLPIRALASLLIRASIPARLARLAYPFLEPLRCKHHPSFLHHLSRVHDLPCPLLNSRHQHWADLPSSADIIPLRC